VRAVTAPSVGVWRPIVGVGAPIKGGTLVGMLQVAGCDDRVVCPDDVAGIVASILPDRTWVEYGTELIALGAVASEAAVAHAGPAAVTEGGTPIKAETDGTIWLSPSPDKPAFAPVGTPVAARGTLALVEVMKTFSPVRAPAAGTVERVLVKSGDAVTAGQVLFLLR
jgi:biotin carboxyl carrier protein